MKNWDLTINNGRLELNHPMLAKPFYQDFVEGSLGYRRKKSKIGKKDLLARAIGYRGRPFSVWDLTAGFGQDSLLLWLMGLKVTSAERNKVVYSLLEDAHRRLGEVEDLSRWEIIYADAVELLKDNNSVEVIFLDPMFPEKKKSALSGKALQILQALLDPVNASETKELLEKSLSKARDRVVVKRPLHAPPIFDGYQYQFTGKTVRYDMYLTRKEN